VNPGVPDGTMIVLISALSSPVVALVAVPVRAVTVTTEVMSEPELVMNCFAPLTTHSPSTRSALVFVAPASEPAPGSVRPKAGQLGAGDQVGEPGLLLLLGAVGEDRVDPEPDRRLERDSHRLVDATDLLDRETQAREGAVLAREPGAAVLLGVVSPNSPSSPILCTTSVGKWCSRSHWAACGAISFCAKSRTVRRNCSCSGESSKLMAAW
jgi:hypothetical protein